MSKIVDFDDDFNPRSDERSDTVNDSDTLDWKISIHAPTNGATSAIFNSSLKFHVFQSTLRRTERHILTSWVVVILSFQSTLRRTERRVYIVYMHIAMDFNPRSDERSDCNFAQKNEKNYTKPLNNIIVFY